MLGPTLCESNFTLQKIQVGGLEAIETNDQARRLDVFNRPQRWLSTCASGQGKSTPVAVQVSEQILPLQGLTVWIVYSPKDLYKNTETGDPGLQRSRYQGPRVPGRFHYSGRNQTPGTKEHAIRGGFALRTRMDYQLGEVGTATIEADGVSGFLNRYGPDEVMYSYGEAQALPKFLQKIDEDYAEREHGEGTDAGGGSGKTPERGPSSPVLMASLTGIDTTATGLHTRERPEAGDLGQSSVTWQGAAGGARVVDWVPQRLERQRSSSDSYARGCLLRCLRFRLRRLPHGGKTKDKRGGAWSLDERRTRVVHQPEGIGGSRKKHQSVPQVGKTQKLLNPLIDRQHSNDGLHQQHGGRFPHLREVADRLLKACERKGVRVVAEHLPGVKNKWADALSRLPKDRSDWKLNSGVFRLLDKRWGPHSIDWFATRVNTQLPRYASWTADEGCVYVDAIKHLHRRENGYANPPFAVIGLVLQKLKTSKQSLTMVVPAWPAQHWWPMLLELMVDIPMLLPNHSQLFTPSEVCGVSYTPAAPPWGFSPFDYQETP